MNIVSTTKRDNETDIFIMVALDTIAEMRRYHNCVNQLYKICGEIVDNAIMTWKR